MRRRSGFFVAFCGTGFVRARGGAAFSGSRALLTRSKVGFDMDKRLRMGEFGIQARLVKPPDEQVDEASQGELGATMVYSAIRGQPEQAVAEKPVARAMLISDGKRFVIDR